MMSLLRTYLSQIGTAPAGSWMSSRIFQPEIRLSESQQRMPIDLEYTTISNVLLITETSAGYEIPIALAFVHSDSSINFVYLGDLADTE